MKELEAKIKSMEHESLMNYNLEQAIKLAINSIYGAFANDYFHFRSTDIAETVTLQGQDAIKTYRSKRRKILQRVLAQR